MKAERIKRYETATVLEVEITQVLDYGCLATVLNDNRKKIFLELVGPNFAQGQRYEVRAEQSGVFKYTTVLDASGKALKPDRGLDVPVVLDNCTVLGQEERVAPVEPCGQPRLFWHIKECSHEVLGPHDCIATAERNFFRQSEANVTRWRSEQPAPGFEPGTY